ncbi:MAG: maleylpyruvate isomerase family mycothiol-dependent enzyme [Gordonia sp. (in: high G+C Gram-positive bacteria)]|uniref:maleylpyruvate isomerase family mycothiol-dependent enzyme n=1 Tax=Gordonia sp. (in: high G+C Gram-positive bacteria) TaxID=84139 RepID=UPI003BB5FECE
MDRQQVRTWFGEATTGFTDTVGQITPDRLDDPALGDWSIRALLGHTTRAFLTIENYLAPGPELRTDEQFLGPVGYFRAALASIGDPAEVSARGVAAGDALGAEPLEAALAVAARVTALVEATDDDATVQSPVGPLRLIDYLSTRAFELTVHSLDLAQAIGAEPGPDLERAARPAIELAAALAEPEDAVHVLRAITGRGGLAEVFTVLDG